MLGVMLGGPRRHSWARAAGHSCAAATTSRAQPLGGHQPQRCSDKPRLGSRKEGAGPENGSHCAIQHVYPKPSFLSPAGARKAHRLVSGPLKSREGAGHM